MITLNNISMRFGARILFEDVTCTFFDGERYAITGPNGAGKTTLMKIITGEIDSTHGSVTRPKKIGVLSQDQFAFDKFRVIDTVIMGEQGVVESAAGARCARRKATRQNPPTAMAFDSRSLKRSVGGRRWLHGDSDAGVLLAGLDVDVFAARAQHGRSKGRPESSCTARASSLRQTASVTSRRSRQTIWISTRFTGFRNISAITRAL